LENEDNIKRLKEAAKIAAERKKYIFMALKIPLLSSWYQMIPEIQMAARTPHVQQKT